MLRLHRQSSEMEQMKATIIVTADWSRMKAESEEKERERLLSSVCYPPCTPSEIRSLLIPTRTEPESRATDPRAEAQDPGAKCRGIVLSFCSINTSPETVYLADIEEAAGHRGANTTSPAASRSARLHRVSNHVILHLTMTCHLAHLPGNLLRPHRSAVTLAWKGEADQLPLSVLSGNLGLHSVQQRLQSISLPSWLGYPWSPPTFHQVAAALESLPSLAVSSDLH